LVTKFGFNTSIKNIYGILVDLASLLKINPMKIFFAAAILIAVNTAVYSQKNVKITLDCGVTPKGPPPLWLVVFKNKTFVMKNEYIKAVNPNTIESINVTKDTTATAIYGAKGAYGVVSISINNKFAGKEFKRLKPFLEKLE